MSIPAAGIPAAGVPAGGIPAPGASVPDQVRLIGGPGARYEPVWTNALGGRTFRVRSVDAPDAFIKYWPRNDEVGVQDEVARLEWAAPFTIVPRVLQFGYDALHEWTMTAALAGESAVVPRWIARPEVAVPAIGVGLRKFHEALPVDECPFRWDIESRIANAAERGVTVPVELREGPPVSALVVCHGDACAPNTLIGDEGEPVGHVDLGALGVGDRWADIAVAAMSTEWNYGPGWQEALVEAYGIPLDQERMAYYQALWNAT